MAEEDDDEKKILVFLFQYGNTSIVNKIYPHLPKFTDGEILVNWGKVVLYF